MIKPLHNARLAVLLGLVSALAALCSAPPAQAQSPSVIDRLSPDTVFYLRWSGLSSLTAAQKTNHLLQLYADPDFAPVRNALVMNLQSGMQKKNTKGPAIEGADLVSLLDNSLVLGFLAKPATAGDTAPLAFERLFSLFVVYDTAGKEALLKKLEAVRAANSEPGSTLSTYSFSGTTVEVRTNGKDVSYSAQIPGRYIMATEKETAEDLITRLTAAAPPASSLIATAEYKSIQPYFASDDALQYFTRIPDYEKWMPAAQRDKPIAHFFRDLHLDKIHVIGGGASFSGPATRFRGAVLGDASPGSIFDIAGASVASFQTLPAVQAGPSFSISRIDYGALYALIRSALGDALTPQQLQAVATYETMARNFLGMPVSDAVALFDGETSTVSSVADDGAIQQSYVVTIQQPQDVLRILRAVIGSRIVSEDSSGTTSYLDLAYPYKDPVSGTQRRSFFYLAVTPDLLIAAPRKAIARQIVAHSSPTAASAPGSAGHSLLDNPQFIKIRAQLPAKLSGLSGTDLTAFPWDKVIANYVQKMHSPGENPNTPPAAPPAWLLDFKPETITRHVQISASGWWKDSNGIYFDSYVQ